MMLQCITTSHKFLTPRATHESIKQSISVHVAKLVNTKEKSDASKTMGTDCDARLLERRFLQ